MSLVFKDSAKHNLERQWRALTLKLG